MNIENIFRFLSLSSPFFCRKVENECSIDDEMISVVKVKGVKHHTCHINLHVFWYYRFSSSPLFIGLRNQQAQHSVLLVWNSFKGKNRTHKHYCLFQGTAEVFCALYYFFSFNIQVFIIITSSLYHIFRSYSLWHTGL